MYEKLLALDSVKLNFTEGSLFFLNITLAVIMVGVSLGVRLKRFKALWVKPKPIIIGLISQIVLLPAVTFLLTMILKVPESIALGMILVAACPGGNISNFMSSLAKANVELSMSLTMFSTIGASLFTPLNFALWGNLYLKFASRHLQHLTPISIDFWQMFQSVLIILLIPLVVGLVLTRFFPKASIKVSPYVRNISIVLFLGMVGIMLYNNRAFLLDFVKLIFWIVFLHNGTALLTGYLFSSAAKLNLKDRKTISIETGIQNSGLGLVLIFNPKLFNGLGGMAAIAAWWGIWHIISGLALGFYWSKRKIKV